jgi:hypothetical protein
VGDHVGIPGVVLFLLFRSSRQPTIVERDDNKLLLLFRRTNFLSTCSVDRVDSGSAGDDDGSDEQAVECRTTGSIVSSLFAAAFQHWVVVMQGRSLSCRGGRREKRGSAWKEGGVAGCCPNS